MRKGIGLIMMGMAMLFFTTSCNTQKATTSQDASVENRQGGQRGGRQGGGPPSVDELFSKMDANGDNMLSQDEVKGPLAQDFDTIDTDNNGLLSKEEVEAAPKPERGQRPQRN